MDGSRSSLRSTFLLRRRAPIPVHAKLDPLTGQITVRFNQTLRTATSAPANWSGRTFSDPFDYLYAHAAAPAGVLGSAVTFTPTIGGMEGGPLTVSYAATPPDLFGECSAVPVAPFVDFPMAGPPSFPRFVSGSFQPLPAQWRLTFSEPITVEPAAFDPRVWRTKLGFLTKLATSVVIAGGLVVIRNPAFSALDDTVAFIGGPPDWTDAEGHPIQAFSHALPS